MLADDGWGTTGATTARRRASSRRAPLAITAIGRAARARSSPLGVASYELDGTSGAGCQEYVEGPTPGTGTWQLIDRNRVDHEPSRCRATTSTARSATCASRPIGVDARDRAHARLVGAELGYRRTWSRHRRPDRPRRSARLSRPRALPERFRSGAGDRRRRGAAVGARARRAARRRHRDRAVRRRALLAAPRRVRSRRRRRARARRRSRARAVGRVLLPDVRRRLDLQRVLDRADHRRAPRATSYAPARPGAAPPTRWLRALRARATARRRSPAASMPASSAAFGASWRGARSTRCGTTATAAGASAAPPRPRWRATHDAVAARPRDRARRARGRRRRRSRSAT